MIFYVISLCICLLLLAVVTFDYAAYKKKNDFEVNRAHIRIDKIWTKIKKKDWNDSNNKTHVAGEDELKRYGIGPLDLKKKD